MLRASRCCAVAPLRVLVPLLLGGAATIAQAQSTWDRYTPGTIAAIMQQHDSTIRADHDPKLPSLVVSGKSFPTLARVTYCGNSRPLNSKRVEVLRHWGLAFHRDSSIVLDFDREYLFQEGKGLLWLPVQDTVASFFARELKPGQLVSLYVVWVGAHYAGEDITWTFLVNEFKAGPGGPRCEAMVVRI
jgi:hypothetical protein